MMYSCHEDVAELQSQASSNGRSQRTLHNAKTKSAVAVARLPSNSSAISIPSALTAAVASATAMTKRHDNSKQKQQ